MAESRVVSALKEKHARLAGELHAMKLRCMALQVELGSVGNCLRIFRCEVDPATIPAKVTVGKNPAGLPKGAGTRTALEILRETGEPMSSQELAACVLERWGRPMTVRSLDMLVKAIHGNFSRRTDGVVEFVRATYPGKWKLLAPTTGSAEPEQLLGS